MTEKQEYHRQYHKNWYLKNREKRSLELRQYNKAHPKESVIRVQKYVKRHPERVKEYNKKFNQTTAGSYRSIANRAKRWTGTIITLEEFTNISSRPCAYCGENEKRIGIDRIDNSKGYMLENSAPCCKLCNFMKKEMTVKEFLDHIEKIYNKGRN